MGISFSRAWAGESEVATKLSDSETMAAVNISCDDTTSDMNDEEYHETSEEFIARAREDEMVEFKRQLEVKRELRREVLAKHRQDKENLKTSLESERKAKQSVMEENKILKELLRKHDIAIPNIVVENTEVHTDIVTTIKQMQEELENLKGNNFRLRRGLAESNFALQSANSDIASLNFQNIECSKQVKALKEVVKVSKTMINLREQQLNELKEKLTEIENSLLDRETSLLSKDLRQEYERQLQNIRTLRGLYEERARLAEVTRLNLLRELEEQKRLNLTEVNKCKELMGKIEELEHEVNTLKETIGNKNEQISSNRGETNGLKAEMSTVNKLFSQVLLGYNSKQNWDQLVHRLEENHGLLTHMVERDNGSETSSALPKLLLELVSQVDEIDEKREQNNENNVEIDCKKAPENYDEDNHSESQSASAEEIVENLPKVWKVLMELLSHQNSNETSGTEKITTCYKTVETASGSALVPSVSQTYIRLKDLILEKLALIKEVNKMKQLNGHLESRLEEQERRLTLVTSELSKTWHVVGRLRRHHHQLHTHEKILKYELQQKRKLLNELKEELEYCREKWEKAREKNTQSERDWRKLRAEFSSRKLKGNSPSFNNSAESGYSDERQSDESSESNDESEYVHETPLRSKIILVTSIDNILDSSADFNLAAEREDPISDMLDVAELPLDTHEIEEGVERPGTSSAHLETDDISISDSCNIKSDKTTEETEDEVEAIGPEYLDELSSVHSFESSNKQEGMEINNETASALAIKTENNVDTQNNLQCTDTKEIKVSEGTLNPAATAAILNIDPSAIMESIRLQNERLAKKDKTLQLLENESSILLRQTKHTLIRSEHINESLDQLLIRPGTSREKGTDDSLQNSEEAVTLQHDCENKTFIPTIEPKQIHEKVETQNECLTKKDDCSIESIEDSTKEENDITNTISIKSEIEENLDTVHSIKDNYDAEPNIPGNEMVDEINQYRKNSTRDAIKDEDTIEASTSKDLDHETRFAARDLRLKRLEEQTKSLVNKVNDTATKRVKINYKLEELHNIYGSDNSRAGTPADENDESNEQN